jgi:hypothetical protein
VRGYWLAITVYSRHVARSGEEKNTCCNSI